MKILWIGKYASNRIFEKMALKGYTDPAAQVSQSNIITSLDELNFKVDTLNAYTVPSDYEDEYVENEIWSRTGESEDISVGFRNIKYISHLFRTKNLKIEAQKWLERNLEEDITIIVYGMQSSLISAALEIKKARPNVEICLIVPDLPQYMDMSMSFIKRILKKIDWIKIKAQLKKINKYVLYTKHMATFLRLPYDKYIVMEGSLNKKNYESIVSLDSKEKQKTIVMYSGKIDKKYGILELLDAIRKINDDGYEFWFTGIGNAVEDLNRECDFDDRIKYLGFLPTRNELLLKQQEATMLINMRLPSEQGSAYCFPSKIFEYMASGKPVLSFRIAGIPDEYYNYLVEIKSTEANDIKDTILKIGTLSNNEIKEIGQKARRYIMNNKNSISQTKKIIEFLGI